MNSSLFHITHHITDNSSTGSNPIAASLLAVFTELAKNPQYIQTLHEEVKDVDCTDSRTLATLPFLNAVLAESMRLHPAIMTGGIRQASKDGVTIAGVFIPSFTNIVAPQYCIARGEFTSTHKYNKLLFCDHIPST
jgi:cytochrome P450